MRYLDDSLTNKSEDCKFVDRTICILGSLRTLILVSALRGLGTPDQSVSRLCMSLSPRKKL